ncbi:unnamed protein product, partial [Didymodactylos carnosus]
APNDIFIRHTKWHNTIWPHLFAVDMEDNDFKQDILPFLRIFPVENPNDRNAIATAILYYMTSFTDDDLSEKNKATTKQIIYLPNLCFILTS